MILRPIGPRVLIRPDVSPDRTETGLHLVEHRKPETSGTVVRLPIRVVHDCPDCGARTALLPDLAVGETVVFSWQSGQEVWIDQERYLLLAYTDVIAVLGEGDPDGS